MARELFVTAADVPPRPAFHLGDCVHCGRGVVASDFHHGDGSLCAPCRDEENTVFTRLADAAKRNAAYKT